MPRPGGAKRLNCGSVMRLTDGMIRPTRARGSVTSIARSRSATALMSILPTRSRALDLLTKACGFARPLWKNGRRCSSAYNGMVGYRSARRQYNLYGNLPADLDDLLAWQPEIVRDVGGVAQHGGEQSFLPMRQRRAAFLVQDDFVADIIDHVVEPDPAALLRRLMHQARNIGPLHEAEMRRHPPEILAFLGDRHQFGPKHPRPRFGEHAQHQNMLVQRPVLFEMPQHHRRHAVGRAGEKHGGARHARNIARLDVF